MRIVHSLKKLFSNKTHSFLIIMIFSLAVLVTIIFIISAQQALRPFQDFLAVIAYGLFPDPHWNGFRGPSFLIYTYLYIFILWLFVFIYLMIRIFKIIKKSEESIYKYMQSENAYFKIMVFMFLFVTSFQTIEQTKYFRFSHQQYAGESIEYKHKMIVGFPYEFVMNVKKHFDGKISAKLITDTDISHSEGMTDFRSLSYFLYPINIRDIDQKRTPTHLIYYRKKDAIDLVPKDFFIKYKFDDNNLVAVKKKE